MMEQIPDAPWIRKAERDGYPEPEPVYCPCCGEECETIFADQYGNIFGCDQCIIQQDAWSWAEDEKERSKPDWAEGE